MSDDPRENPAKRPQMPARGHDRHFDPRMGKDYDPPNLIELENAGGRYRCDADGCDRLLEPVPEWAGLPCPDHPGVITISPTPARPYTRIVLTPEAVNGIGVALDEMQPTPDMAWLPPATQRRIRVARQLLVLARGMLHIPGEHYDTIDDDQVETLERYLVQTTDLDFE